MRKPLAATIVIASLSLLTAVSQAAEIQVARSAAAGVPTRVFVTGEMFTGDEARFAKHVFEMVDGIVILDSPGGDVEAGLAIGRTIRERGLATLVPIKYECASACALAWLGGRVRYMSPKGAIGFHAAYYLGQGGQMSERGMPNALVGAYLNGLGLSDEAIIFITSAPPESMNWLTFETANRIGIEVLPWEVSDEPSLENARAVLPGQNASTAPGGDAVGGLTTPRN
jgi:hypothetical protein